ncbi:MAG TPA: S1/P1 nuclease [Lysobacter sp.]
MCRILPLAVLAALFLALAGPVVAWSALGHKLVGELAQRHLSRAADAEVRRLLAGEPNPTLAGVASWADGLRDADPERFKATTRWHWVNFAEGQCQYVPERDCPDGNCVVGAIEAQRRILGDRSRPREARRDALKFLVHFVGDVHQPMHASNRPDQGGNRYQVSLRTDLEPEAYARKHHVDGVMGTNLHSVWDYYVLGEARLSLDEYADRLDRQPWPPAVASPGSGPAAWAGESCRLIDSHRLYPVANDGRELHKMDRSYPDAQRALAEQRVRQAAYRLASLLNETLAK